MKFKKYLTTKNKCFILHLGFIYFFLLYLGNPQGTRICVFFYLKSVIISQSWIEVFCVKEVMLMNTSFTYTLNYYCKFIDWFKHSIIYLNPITVK